MIYSHTSQKRTYKTRLFLVCVVTLLCAIRPVYADDSSAYTVQRGDTFPLYAKDPRVPDPLPPLPVLFQAQHGSALPLTYAQVVQDDAPVYSHPFEADRDLPPKRRLGTGFVWVSVQGDVTYIGYGSLIATSPTR
jgi:hypothetical protein